MTRNHKNASIYIHNHLYHKKKLPKKIGCTRMKCIKNVSVDYARYLRIEKKMRRNHKELLLFCEHPSVITAGTKTDSRDLFLTPEELAMKDIAFYKIYRGGSYVAHEEGQCVIYPHIDLLQRSINITDFIEAVLQITIKCLQKIWQLECIVHEDNPGLYVRKTGAKIAFIGVAFHRYFTSHGIAINIDNTRDAFSYFNPCGIKNIEITSVQKEGRDTRQKEDFIRLWENEFRAFLK